MPEQTTTDVGAIVEQLTASITEAMAIPTTPDVLTTDQAAAYLSVKPQTLAKWRAAQTGPPYAKRGHWVRYRRAALDQWLEEQEITPT